MTTARVTSAAALAALLVSAGTLPAQVAAPAPPVPVAAIDSFVQLQMQEKNLAGLSVGIMRDGDIVFAKGYGNAVLSGPVPADSTTRFAIGSVSKQFTCAIILQLAAEGKLSVTDPVSTYFKGLTRGDDIRLVDLMNHVSGYPDYYPLDFLDRRMLKPIATEELIATYAGMQLDFEPGTRYSYSNTGFVMLGRVAELVTGQAFATLLQDRIFGPLDMPHTVIDPTATGNGYAQGYISFALGPLGPSAREGEGWIGAAGGIWSTAPDLLRWDRALMEGRVVRGEWLELMTRPRVLRDSSVSPYGAGIAIGTIGGDTAWSHTGAVSGFAAQNFMVPRTRSAIVVLSNTESGMRAGQLWRLVLPIKPSAPADSTAPRPRAPAETPVPAVAGPPAQDVATTLLRQMQQGKVDRQLLDPEFSWFLTDTKIREAAPRLAALGTPTATKVVGTAERGGLEVTVTQFTFPSQKVNALLYRAPDGKVFQFLLLAP